MGLFSFVEDVFDAGADFVGEIFDAGVDFIGSAGGGLVDSLGSIFGLDFEVPDLQAGMEGTLITKTGNVQLLPVVYGKRRVGGVLIFAEVTGDDNEFLWLAYALADADNRINFVGDYYLDDVISTDSKFTALEISQNTEGQHTGQPFSWMQTGGVGGGAPSWTSDHKLLGVAAISIRLGWAPEVFSGLPKTVFELYGTEVLNLNALPTESRRYSANPAEILFDYLTNDIYGKGLSKVDGVDIDLQSFKDARDYCNDSITSYFGGPPHTRMECHLVLQTGRTIMQNVKTILQTCRGTLPLIDGVFHLVIEKHYTPADYGLGSYFDFNTDNVIGSWGFKVGDIATRYNRVKVTYPNEDIDYKPDYVIVESSTFRTADQRLLEKTIALEGTTNVYRAIDTGSVILRRSRQQIAATFLATPEAMQVRAGTIVTVTHETPGWSAKQFRVSKMTLLKSGNCAVTLVEHDSTVYNLSLRNKVITAPDTNLPDPTVVPTLATPTLTSDETVLKIAADGTLIPQIQVVWVVPDNIFVNGYDVEFKLSSDSVWIAAGSPNSLNTNEQFIPNVTELTDYDVRIRAKNSGGFIGAWTTVTDHTVIGKTSNPSDVADFSALQNGRTMVFKWARITDNDLSGYDIRYGPRQATTWEDATPLTEVTKGNNVTSADVPPGDWTFFIKAVDTGKRRSTNATSTDAVVDNTSDVIISQLNAPDWPGTLTNFVRHWTGVLIPSSTSTNVTDLWDTFDTFVPTPAANPIYETPEIDIDFDDTARVWGDIISALGPGETGTADPDFLIDHHLDGGSYDGFELWSIGQLTLRKAKARASMDTTVGVAFLQQMEFVVDQEEHTLKVDSLTVAAGGTTVVFSHPFHNTPFVRVFTEGSALLPTRDSITSTGFDFHLWNTSGTDVGGIGSYEATGV